MKFLIIGCMLIFSTLSFAADVCVAEERTVGTNPDVFESCNGSKWKRPTTTISGVIQSKLNEGYKIQSTLITSSTPGTGSTDRVVVYVFIRE